MGLFKKRKITKEVILEDNKLVKNNANEINALIELADGNSVLIAKLKEFQEKIKYLSPSQKLEIAELDNKIGNKLGDIRIIMNKGNVGNSAQIERLFKDINLMIADRQTAL